MPRTDNVVLKRESRYVQGGTTDVYPNRAGWWERRTIPHRDTDRLVIIQPQEAKRPDRLAYRIYGRAGFQWIVLLYNNIVDINTEFLQGRVLRVPSQRRVTMDLMTRPTGGNKASL